MGKVSSGIDWAGALKHLETTTEKMNFLVNEIKKHDRLYNESRPIITDSEYDALYMELVKLEKTYPELKDPDSPTENISYVVVDGLKKVQHVAPMLSQENISDAEGVRSFASRSKGTILMQQKLDGLTIVLTYDNGLLKHAVTRGNGEIGDDVSHNIATVRNVPSRIPFDRELVVRAEAIIPFEEFERINIDGKYSNPRNLASGTIRQLDSSIAASRNLEVIVFELISIEGNEFRKDTEQLQFLELQGFTVVETFEMENSTEEDVQRIASFAENYGSTERNKLPHMIDGLILKFNDLSTREELGSASKYPKWSCAYKFPSLDATTTLTDVVFQVGKSGQITPVAEFETVSIDSVNISRATLHNFRNIRDKDIRIGDRIVVERAKDVIPRVVQSIHSERSGEEFVISPPLECPACGSYTVMTGENLFCTGVNCKPQLEGKLEHFVSRDAMNIDGLGAKTVTQLYAEGIIDSVADIYKLHEMKEKITGIPGFGERKYEKMIEGIEASKSRPFNHVLYSLSIPLIGRTASSELAKHFKSLSALVAEYVSEPKAFESKIMSLPDFGETMTFSLIDFLMTESNLELIKELEAAGLSMESDYKEPVADSNLIGKVFAITGTLSRGRGEIKKEIESLGGKVSRSVSKKTDYLLMSPDAEGTTKHTQAVQHGVTILSEEEYLKMI